MARWDTVKVYRILQSLAAGSQARPQRSPLRCMHPLHVTDGSISVLFIGGAGGSIPVSPGNPSIPVSSGRQTKLSRARSRLYRSKQASKQCSFGLLRRKKKTQVFARNKVRMTNDSSQISRPNTRWKTRDETYNIQSSLCPLLMQNFH